MQRFLCLLVALFMLIIGINACLAESKDEGIHNYILIIDNSRSTTGRHSLGGATDPKGLRFDAAKLVYENVVSSAATGSRGQIGVIVFCGTENCVSYGPLEIDSDPALLSREIGDQLNEKANEDHRDNYTDIRTALDAARDMLGRFEGDTSIILLTDGVNDLTNTSDPFNRPENIEANDQSVAIVGDFQYIGADFYVIALTAQDSIRNTDAFMDFINRMAQAGGGHVQQDGSYDNVLMATQEDLSSKLLQMLIKAETSPDTDIQNFEQSTPLNKAFTVPFKGISEAKVNITFMPGDKSKLASIVLISPDGSVYKPYDENGAIAVSGITVTEDRSFIILGIAQPASGTWNLEIDGRNGAQVPVNTVVRFSHRLRLKTETSDQGFAGEAQTLKAWFQFYDGTKYVDLKDSEIYEMSTATLELVSPSGKAVSVTLTSHEDHFSKSLKLKSVGLWWGVLNVENRYISKTADDIRIEIVERPTPTPTPVPSPTPTSAPTPTPEATPTSVPEQAPDAGGSIQIAGEGDQDYLLEIGAVPDSNSIEVSWSGGEEGTQAELRVNGSDTPVMTGIRPGDKLDLSALDPDSGYSLVIVGQDKETGGTVPMQAFDLKLVDSKEAVNAGLMLVDAFVQLTPAILNAQTAGEGKAMDLQDEAGPSGADGQAEAGLAGAMDDSDGPGLTLDGDGDTSAEKTATAEPEPSEAPEEDEAQEPTDAPEATEAPQPSDTPQATAEPVQNGGVMAMLGNYWMFILGGVCVLAVLAVVATSLAKKGGKKVVGSLRITCDAIFLETLLRFDSHSNVNVNSPLTAHPEIARKKGSKIYDVLSNIRVGMTQADFHGLVEGSEDPHLPNESLISVTYTDPRNGSKQVCYCGKNDMKDSVLNVYDAGRTYDVHFSGSLSFDEIVNNRR